MLTDFAGGHARYLKWLETIHRTHERRITVQVLTLEHDVIATISPRFVDGSLDVDVTRTPMRMAELQLLDPSRTLAFEPDSPSDIPLQQRRLIRVGWSVRVPELNEWITCPIITGTVADFDRVGALVTLRLHGKETLAAGQAGRGQVWPKKTKKTSIIRALLRAAGENRLAIPDLDATTPEKITVRTMDSRWSKATEIAQSKDRVLFYNARGTAVLRGMPGKPGFTFSDRNLASEVLVDRDSTGLKNRWIVQGAKPKGKKQRIAVNLVLPRKHPLSPWSLGRALDPDHPGDVEPRYLIEQIDNPQLKTREDALRVARRRRDDGLRALTTYSFDAMPVGPHLEEFDLVRVVTDTGTYLVRMRTWSLPLGLDGAPTMTVGSIRRTTVKRGRPHRGGGGGQQGGRGGRGGRSAGADPFSTRPPRTTGATRL